MQFLYVNDCFPNTHGFVIILFADEPIGIVFKTWRGPPAGELNLTFVCDIANPGTPITRARLCKKVIFVLYV